MSINDVVAYPLQIDTPEGIATVTAVHKVVERDDVIQCATVTVVLDGVTCVGHGDDTEYALYDLAKHLPQGCRLRCCLSCRHGHFCPVGDADNELFCVTDFEPKEKSDLYHVTEDAAERAKRSRSLFCICERYQLQSPEYYTYSEYLHRVK
ncbi:MAG: hypothetical protein IKL25_08625 [Clostridia bacterium]|nr:hypothetical protein [Clostridia bacterium]